MRLITPLAQRRVILLCRHCGNVCCVSLRLFSWPEYRVLPCLNFELARMNVAGASSKGRKKTHGSLESFHIRTADVRTRPHLICKDEGVLKPLGWHVGEDAQLPCARPLPDDPGKARNAVSPGTRLVHCTEVRSIGRVQ